MVALDILLVDDEEIAHQSVGRYLRKCGHRVTDVMNGTEALQAIESSPAQIASQVRRDQLADLVTAAIDQALGETSTTAASSAAGPATPPG